MLSLLAIHLLAEAGAGMVEYSTPPEAIDDAFIQVLAKELIWKTASPAAGAGQEESPGRQRSDDETASSAPTPPSQAGHLVSRDSGRSASGEQMTAACWRVRVVEAKGPEQLLTFEHGPVTIGRSPANSIAVRCVRVSRKHVRIWLDEAGPWAEDLSGRGRLRVNGTRMPSSRLQPGDVIEIGTVKIYVEYLGSDRLEVS
jgi:hypothetical protein